MWRMCEKSLEKKKNVITFFLFFCLLQVLNFIVFDD